MKKKLSNYLILVHQVCGDSSRMEFKDMCGKKRGRRTTRDMVVE